jgi:hypothetical protein
VIGVDFDNTLVSYDALLKRLAVERGWVPPQIKAGKREIRDFLRRLPDGEIRWQKLQAAAYGPRIAEAPLPPGVQSFFELCKLRSAKVYVVSHKTELAGYDETGTNLRAAALDWMASHGLFGPDGPGLTPQAVYFGATRQEKIAHIAALGCTHFIDDLEETFLEEQFPRGVVRILYDPNRSSNQPPGQLPGVTVAASWQAIAEYVFDHAPAGN